MTRRTFAEVARAAVVQERVALARFAAEHRRQVEALALDGRCGAEEAEMLNERIGAMIDQVMIGLHVGGESAATRKAVRAALTAEGLLPRGRS